MAVDVVVRQQNLAMYVAPDKELYTNVLSDPLFDPTIFISNLQYILSHREYRDGSLRKLTKAEVARRLGVNRKVIWFWLNKVTKPRAIFLMEVNLWAEQLRQQKQQSSPVVSVAVSSGHLQ